MKQKTIKILSITFALLVAFFVALYLLGSNSEPYEVAEDFVLNSNKIKKEFGKVSDLRLAFFGHSMHYDGTKGNADLELVVYSGNKKGSVYLTMRKETGKWIIKKAGLKEANSYINILEQ